MFKIEESKVFFKLLNMQQFAEDSVVMIQIEVKIN